MKKSIFIIASLAAVVLLSSFVIARNVTNNKTENPVTVSANDGWEYLKPITVYYNEGESYTQFYIWKKSVCGDPDYLLSSSSSRLEYEASISKNYNYGKERDWTSKYKYVSTKYFGGIYSEVYFSTYLQGWD